MYGTSNGQIVYQRKDSKPQKASELTGHTYLYGPNVSLKWHAGRGPGRVSHWVTEYWPKKVYMPNEGSCFLRAYACSQTTKTIPPLSPPPPPTTTKPLANHWLTREPAYRPSLTGRTASLCQPPVSESLSRSQFRPLSLDSKTKNEVYSNTAIHIVLKIMLKTNPFQCRNWDCAVSRRVTGWAVSVCGRCGGVSVSHWVSAVVCVCVCVCVCVWKCLEFKKNIISS